MKTSLKVYFVRHGQTDWNVAHRIQGGGAAEVDLNAAGVAQAEAAADGLARAGLSFDRIYASPYRRARHTAEIICARLGGRPVLDDRLREIDFGDYNGATYGAGGYEDENIRAAFENPQNFVPHSGESYPQFLARVGDFIDNELKPLEGVCDKVLVVAHRGVLNAVATILEKRDLSQFWKNDTGNCGMDVAELRGGVFTLVGRGLDLRGARVSGAGVAPAPQPEPLARFGVIADVHIQPSDAHRSDVLRDALRYFDARKTDGVVACGDLTQNGTIEELREFGAIWDSVFPGDRRSDGEHVEKLFVYGDHDTEPSFYPKVLKYRHEHGDRCPDWLEERGDIALNDRAAQWKAAFHEDFAPIMRKRVKGFDFVLAHLVNLDEDGMRYADPLHIPGLEEFFAVNTFDPARPFFYVQHKIPKGTVGGPTQTGQDSGRTSAILSKFPNAISLNGHKHRSATEELSLWQGAFTAIQAPSLFTLLTAAGRENGRCSCDAAEPVPVPQMAQLDTVPDGSHALVLSIWSDRIVVDRVDIIHGGEPVAVPWVIPWPNDGSASFEARGRDVPAPQFSPGAKVSARMIDGGDRAGNAQRQVEVRFPAAQSTATTPRAYDYEVQAVLRKALVTRVVCTKRVYSPKCYWPEKYDRGDVVCLFGRAEIPNNHDSVTFVVRPLNAWGIAGEPIASEPAAYEPSRPLYPY